MRNMTQRPFVAAVSAVLAMLLLALSFVFISVDRKTLAANDLPVFNMPAVEVKSTPEFTTADVADDVLWLARVIYSETKRNDEQELVAWTVRNRVETGYRGKKTFKSVVLDPWQYSAFNSNSPKRSHYSTLAPASTATGFQSALRVAHEVYYADASERPFAETTRHFYSERSMVGGKAPNWAVGQRPVQLADHDIDPRRFRFYAAIA
ncbi:MAG: hypothetical protein ABJF88_19330 [Rhodothermales bacterium]